MEVFPDERSWASLLNLLEGRESFMDIKENYKDKGKIEPSADWLRPLTVMGRILIAVPFIIGLPLVLYSLFSGRSTGSGCSEDGAYAAGMVFLSGLVTLIYVSIKRFHEGIRGGREPDDNTME